MVFLISRLRRLTSSTDIKIEMREDPSINLTSYNTTKNEALLNVTANIANRFQSGEMQVTWAQNPATNNTSPTGLTVQEPFSQTNDEMKVISYIILATQPSSCRAQSPCTIQPVIVAYDSAGNIIQKLGSISQPWKVVASVVSQSNVNLSGSIANYSTGQSQYSLFGLPSVGTYQVQFTIVPPMGVNT
jgi:hypothetical protein